MEPFRVVTGGAVPLDRADVDTDQIIPAQYLKRIERTGYGRFLFQAWRQQADFVLNRPEFASATILLAGPNFGGGSSREHAVWALEDYGFRAVISISSETTAARSGCFRSSSRPSRSEHSWMRSSTTPPPRSPSTSSSSA